jgi:flavin-dependent dehydrogenase
MNSSEIIIIGGGLAGLTAAMELAASGREVTVFEKQRLPHHKVCGEYLSKEVVPYLEQSGIALDDAPHIDHLVLSSSGGRKLTCPLPLGGIGISRYALDYRLFKVAEKAGVRFMWESVDAVRFEGPNFIVTTRVGVWEARHVIGSWGKRSALDRVQNRRFFTKSSPWMGIKMHYRAQYPKHQVGLYGFKGGYGGLSVTETGAVNFCYLIHKERFQQTPNLESCTRSLLKEHPALHQTLEGAEPLFEKALGISNIYFGAKGLVKSHVLMAGDAARLIHPLCGNGMAMAIQTGRLQGEILRDHIKEGGTSRQLLERRYKRAWEKEFKTRLWVGARLQDILTSPNGLNLGIRAGVKAPFLLRNIIRKTHGTA